MKRFISTALLTAFLSAPVALLADEHHHEWNDSENVHWHEYLKERHKREHDWEKANKREQRDYWKWREHHHHEDH
jgi:Ni/Co efflux regulator RcnB